MSFLTYITILSLLALADTLPSDAASTAVAPPPLRAPRGPATVAQFLSAINAARADAGVLPLSWNTTVAQRAKLQLSWLRASAGCDLSKKDGYPTRLHEAMTFFRGPNSRPTPADAVATWVSERQWYDRGTDACAPGQECGSYKLVVALEWRQLGCALVACPSGGAVAACAYLP